VKKKSTRSRQQKSLWASWLKRWALPVAFALQHSKNDSSLLMHRPPKVRPPWHHMASIMQWPTQRKRRHTVPDSRHNTERTQTSPRFKRGSSAHRQYIKCKSCEAPRGTSCSDLSLSSGAQQCQFLDQRLSLFCGRSQSKTSGKCHANLTLLIKLIQGLGTDDEAYTTLHYMRWFGYSMSIKQSTLQWGWGSGCNSALDLFVRYTRSFSYGLTTLIFTTDKKANAVQLVAPRPRH
jgi:hypothetical protein